MTDSNHIPAALSLELKELFTDPELVELTFLIGYINMLNLFNNCRGALRRRVRDPGAGGGTDERELTDFDRLCDARFDGLGGGARQTSAASPARPTRSRA